MLMIESLKTNDNVMSKPKADRGRWAEGLGLKDLTKEKADVVFHAGCRYSFDEEMWMHEGLIPHLKRLTNAVHKEGGIAILVGNLAPKGSVVKAVAVSPKMLKHTGPAKIYDSEKQAEEAMNSQVIDLGNVGMFRERIL
jgi:dihydroxyacid dehydratase/phosphogluconate dehydratase